MGVPPDPPVDLSFLSDPLETEEQRQAFLGSAIHYARRACALADELLDPGQAWAKSPEGRRAAQLAAAAAARACAAVAQTLELRVFHMNSPAPPEE
jgi:hypothetical protein